MRRIYDNNIKSTVVMVEQGEFVVFTEDLIATTTLGSCVAVCLFDQANGISGMNHFMLPEPLLDNEESKFREGRYGIYSLELLIKNMIKNGSDKSKMVARIFGGANMFKACHISQTRAATPSGVSVGEQNVNCAIAFLKERKIRIVGEDIIGTVARKVYFNTVTGEAKVSPVRLGPVRQYENRRREEEYKRFIILKRRGKIKG